MATKFVTNLDLNQNQILNGKFEIVATDPSTNNFEGRMIYNSTEDTIKVYSGSAWRKMIHAVSSSTTALTSSESNGTVSLSIADATTSVSGLMSATDKTKLDDATSSNTASKIVQRDASGNFSAGTITAALTGNVTGDVTGTVSSIANHDTDDLAEGATNKYYTDARVQLNRLDQLAVPTASVSLNSQKITNLADPTDAQDAATKAYVDAARSGLDVKQSVRASTTENITLANTQTIDNIVLVAGDRVLVKNQSTASENGIYVVVSGGSWTRATDANSNDKVTPGLFAFVEEGSVNGDSGWVLTTDAPITLGTTGLTFAQFSGTGQITAGDGLTKTGNTLAVNTGTGLEINSDTVRIAASAAGDGLTGGGGSALAVNVAANGGLEIATDAVQIKINSSVSGLETGSGGLALKSNIAGTGLTFTTGVLSVNAVNLAAGGSGGVTGTLPIGNGGTGSTTASGARTALVGDITPGTGVSTPALARVASKAIGDGVETSYTVVHNFNTRDVIVQVYDASNYDTVIADVVRTDANTVTVLFSTAPASNAFKVVVTG